MMYSLIPIIAISIYVGNVLGFLMLSETIPELSKAKKYAWQIPIVSFFYFVYILCSPEVKGERFQTFCRHIKVHGKNILVAYAMVETAKEIAEERKKGGRNQPSKQTAQRLFKGYGRAVLSNTYSYFL